MDVYSGPCDSHERCSGGSVLRVVGLELWTLGL